MSLMQLTRYTQVIRMSQVCIPCDVFGNPLVLKTPEQLMLMAADEDVVDPRANQRMNGDYHVFQRPWKFVELNLALSKNAMP